MRALSLVEAADIPLMSSLSSFTGNIEMILDIQYVLPMPLTSEQLFDSWLTRGGTSPPTWRKLLQIIRQLSLDDLAYQVETYLRTGTAIQVVERKAVMTVKGKRIEVSL